MSDQANKPGKTASSRKDSGDESENSEFESVIAVEEKVSQIKRKHIRLNSKSRKTGGHSGVLKKLITKASRKSKRPSSRKSQVKGFRNNEGYKGRISVIRGVSITPKSFPGFKKLARATSKVSQAFRDWGDRHRHHDDKSSTSGHRLDPETKEAFEQLKMGGQPEDLGEARAIIETMNKFNKSQEIQHLGLTLMAGIAIQEPLGLINNGILDIIISVFDSFPTTGKLLESACVMIWNLGTEDSIIGRIMEKNVDEKVVWVLSSKRDKEGPFKFIDAKNTKHQGSALSLSPAAQLLYKAVGALKVLAVNEKCKAKLADQGVIPLMIHCFQFLAGDAPNDQYAQETCIACIQNFCNGPRLEEYCEQVFKNQGHLLIMRSMLKLHYSLEIQLVGCAAIWNMCLEKQAHRKKMNSLKLGGNIEEVLEVEPEDNKQEKTNVYPSKTRRVQLAQIGAGSRAVAAMKRFKEDNRVVARAMGALKALVMNDEEILNIVRNDVHKKNNRTKDIGLVNIFDVIQDAVQFHDETDQTVTKFGYDLLITFEIEDTENTNRAEIEKLSMDNRSANMTLQRLENPDGRHGMEEVAVPNDLKLKPRANKGIKTERKSSMEKLFSRKSLTQEFTGEPTPQVQRKDVQGLSAMKVSDLVRNKKPKKPKATMQEESKPSVLLSPPQQKVQDKPKVSDGDDLAAFEGMDVEQLEDDVESTI